MPFSNLDFLYNHLPARNRREDQKLSFFLKRFLTYAANQLDGWDTQLDTFHQKINPGTAPEDFVEWWLWALFGWSWYPEWMELPRKRILFADFGQHLARRGTKRGIEEFLKAFSIFSRVYTRPSCADEAYIGEDEWSVEEPLGIVVRISHLADEVNPDLFGQAVEEAYCEESFVNETKETLTRREIEELIRFEWPMAQRLMVEYQVRPNLAGPEGWETRIPFNEDVVPDENSGVLTGF